jgi:GTP-binding protein Era
MSDAGDDGKDRGSVGAEAQHCGFIAVIGAPNAGKSTLINRLVGAKVAIVSHKVQTTRVPLRGIATEGASQLVFIDTPGLFAPRRRLEQAMVEAAWGGARDADLVVLVIDAAKGIDDDLEPILAKLKDANTQRIAVLNKIDRVADKEKLLALAGALEARVPFAAIFMISALSGSGVADLKRYLAAHVPPGPWHYPADDLSDAPLRQLAAELTREKIFNRLHDEIPYATTVETTSWEERKDGSVRVEQTIFVARDGQKALMLGKGGQTIKQISTESRLELAGILERPVHLFLFVKVRQGWQNDPERYREMGLELPKLERPKK